MEDGMASSTNVPWREPRATLAARGRRRRRVAGRIPRGGRETLLHANRRDALLSRINPPSAGRRRTCLARTPPFAGVTGTTTRAAQRADIIS